MRALKDLVIQASERWPGSLAVTDPTRSLTYAELDALATAVARGLADLGVGRGDRVGIWHEKSVDTVAIMQGVLRLGAAYVPLDPLSPPARIRTIIEDCAMRAVVTTAARAEKLGASAPCLIIGDDAWAQLATRTDPLPPSPELDEHDLAYILYTSGSTGRPKGVCISQRNALAFIDWAVRALAVTPTDRLSNHAPFHFDLTVLDLYAAFAAGASAHIIPDGASYVPSALVELVTRRRITLWYSVPTVLVMMMESGGLLDLENLPIRAFAFAGEPFPIKHLRVLFERFPRARFLNLYGPTETNVCTFHEVETIEPDRVRPVPIGVACSGDEVWAERPDGTRAGIGEEGELIVRGPTVALGYWGREPQGDAPYRTGDRVVLIDELGTYEYVGRLDQMVKVHGYRIELGDVEAALSQHPDIHEVAVAVAGDAMSARLVAFIVARGDAPAPSVLSVKRHCAELLPRYMIVDEVKVLPALPRTRNGKIDRLWLAEQVK